MRKEYLNSVIICAVMYFLVWGIVDGLLVPLHQVISGHLGWVRSIAVEPGNQWFVTGSADRTIKVSTQGHVSYLNSEYYDLSFLKGQF